MRIVLLGAPGSGKGTQAASLAKSLGLAHIASGDLFRDEQARGTKLGLLVKQYMERGELVPDAVTVQTLLGRIAQPDCAAGFVLDGFPRTIQQAEALQGALRASGAAGIDKVVYIQVSEDELLRRLSGRWICRARQHPYHASSAPPKQPGRCDIDGSELYQRPDDTEETARRRLGVYHRQTVALIGYYRSQGTLVEIDGERSISEVGKQLVAALQ